MKNVFGMAGVEMWLRKESGAVYAIGSEETAATLRANADTLSSMQGTLSAYKAS